MKSKQFIWLLAIVLLIYVIDKGLNRLTGNEYFLSKLNKSAAVIFRMFIKDIERLGYTVIITSGKRTNAEQAALKKQDERNASAGSSAHNYGTALDFVLQKNGKTINKSSPAALWNSTGVPQLANKHGISWGGVFPNYYDPVHFYIKG
jgi:LAS superfamily LD-carboxypeptidase LdcB